MCDKTEKMLAEMVVHAKAGHEVIPAFFQPMHGHSAAVSSAIRLALKRGLLVEAGKDGCGKPKYCAPVPTATHTATTTRH
ncbi:hypothetical protein HUU40_00245 [candidate division KSB1 bacterium]|nr:hypothetical protein [candidate division KSB1 bacterium]